MSDPSDGGDGDRALPQGDRLQSLLPEELDLLWGRPRFSRSAIEDFENLALRPQPHIVWDGLSDWTVTMSERFPGRFEIERNVGHSRVLLRSWGLRKAV